ncbi:MAG TPA: diguanylate cyclase [Clostridia bacterium]|nr:diguanylate cyclase [Clostridia bacterium]
MSEKQKLALVLNTLAIALVFLFVFLAVRDFLNQTKSGVEENFTNQMQLIADDRVEDMFSKVVSIETDAFVSADSLSRYGGLQSEAAKECFRWLSKRGTFDQIGVAYLDGSVAAAYGGRGDVSGEGWFADAATGKRGIYAVDEGGWAYLTIYAPVYHEGRIEGIFFGRYNAARMDEGTVEKLNGEAVLSFLVRKDGSFIYSPVAQTLFSLSSTMTAGGFWTELESVEFLDSSSLASVKSGMERERSGNFCVRTQLESAYVYYAPLGVNDWYLVLTVDHSALTTQNAKQSRTAVELLAKVLFALLVATLIVLFYSWASKQEALNSANRINAMTNSIPCGVQQFEPLGNMAFRYVSDGFFQMSGYSEEELRTVFGNSFLAVIHPEDRDQTEALIRGNLDTENPLELKYRIITKDGRVVWMLNRATLCADEAGGAYYQCVCVDITRLKQLEQSLASKAQLDQLTGLYNREAARMLIREFFGDASSRYGNHAFFMMDMDGFKKHNDTYGHVEGDRLLCRVAGILRSTFRGTDVICRLAGDEFVVFMKSAESREVIVEKAQNVCRRVEELKNADDQFSPSISISIGISLAPQDGNNFEELYKKADEALYAAKRSGKNRHVFYDAMPAFSEQNFFDDEE